MRNGYQVGVRHHDGHHLQLRLLRCQQLSQGSLSPKVFFSHLLKTALFRMLKWRALFWRLTVEIKYLFVM